MSNDDAHQDATSWIAESTDEETRTRVHEDIMGRSAHGPHYCNGPQNHEQLSNHISVTPNQGSKMFEKQGIYKSRVDHEKINPEISHVELIERKGIGHPDSIADELAARLSRDYSRYTIANCDGQILHHQFDKTMIVGGKTEVGFGSGRFVEPIRIVLAGRASRKYGNQSIPVMEICKETIRRFFAERFPMIPFDEMVSIHDFLTTYAGPGTTKDSIGAIANMFSPTKKGDVRGYENLVANDTSYCVAYAPFSALETAVLELEGHLTGPVAQSHYPWLGSDIKIMAYRQHEIIEITACIPQICAHVNSLGEYKKNLEIIHDLAADFLSNHLPGRKIKIALNTKDDYDRNNIYLTVSGASLSGDIGVVGRGNRTNGLITSQRPMSLEGTNGKNPKYYSGFIYAVATKRIAERILAETGAANSVEMVVQNGAPLLHPWATRVCALADSAKIREVVAEEIQRIPDITADFVSGEMKNH